MRTRRKKLKLLFRRAIVCVCCAGIIYSIALGTAAMVSGIRRQTNSERQPASIAEDSTAKAGPMSKTESASSAQASFNGALFIGDSRTEGLQNYDGLSGAQYYAIKGLMVSTVYTKPAVNSGGEKVTIMQALQKNKFDRIYVMLGVNELGWDNTKTFVNDYSKMIDDIKRYQPQAKIFVQSILPVSEKKSESDKIYNNDKIASYNSEIQKIASEQNVNYLQVNTAVCDSTGGLPAEASSDGVHLNRKYCKIWCDYLRAHI
jgi:hypothetical protein